MPAEWEEQEAVWLSWPNSRQIWPGKTQAIWQRFAHLVALLARYQCVRINAAGEIHADIIALLEGLTRLDGVELFAHATDDVWCRDHGPIWLKDRASGRVSISDWGFDGWGGKFKPYDLDNALPEKITNSLQLKRSAVDKILEGGSIDSNGQGCLLTTESVLLHPNRKNGLSKSGYESLFECELGVSRTIWLPHGVPDDDTDGHVDNVARFFAEDKVIAVAPEGDLNLQQNIDILKGHFAELVELPQVRGRHGEVCFPASYANFVVLNNAVIVPGFGHARLDQRACDILSHCFPGREISSFDTSLIVEEGGGLHCLSSNQPGKVLT